MMLASRSAIPRPTSATVAIPAPVGVNLVDTAGSLPPGDCLSMINLFRAENGARTRSGYREWVTGLGGEVRSVFGFQGSPSDGSEDRLFANTSHGIWNVTASTSTPSEVLVFALSSAKSGWGVARGFTTTAGGHFLLYCDEENGYHVWDESTDTWTKIVAGVGAGDINGTDPDNFAFVTAWKRRLWFVQADSASAWYLPVNQYAGTVTEFDFGPQFRHGGRLVGLWSWTIDGGSGIDDLLVAISSSGDVVVYQGSDPADANTFALRGVWYAGAVPAGRRIATEHGGDLLILSALGVFPLSKLVGGASIDDPDLYATRKIAPAINTLMTNRRSLLGWFTAIHPEDGTLIVGVPQLSTEDRIQWVMSLTARGWSLLEGLDMLCAESYAGKLYFGSESGIVYINDGDVDNNQSTGSTNAIAIDSRTLTGFMSLGGGERKRLHLARPQFMTSGTAPQYDIAGRVAFDQSDLGSVSYVNPTGTELIWDVGAWDVNVWGTGTGTAGEWRGVIGFGTPVALILRMSTKSRATLTNLDLVFDTGGIL